MTHYTCETKLLQATTQQHKVSTPQCVAHDTTALVDGQSSKCFSVYLERVARATTVTDVLETLLKQANIVSDAMPRVDLDTVAKHHVQG